jgi:microsomal dipeptidase-like Zn-dependent dipeptidase
MLIRRVGFVIILAGTGLVAASTTATRVIEQKYNQVRNQPPYTVPAAAADLQQKLFVADLHADSLLWGRNLLKRSASGHVDIPRLQQAHVSLQAFTVVTTIPRHLNIERNLQSSDLVRYLAIAEGWPPSTWSSPKERALYQAGRLRAFAADSGGALVLIRTRSDLRKFVATRATQGVAAILGAEGAQPLEGNLENLNDLYDAGFRMMSPTHFTDTDIAGSASGQLKGGLTGLGRGWVHSMEAKGMLIDLAHASPATIRDVTAMASRPVIVSHTGVKGTCNNNRNLSDDQLRSVARTGGVIGVGYWETAVCGLDARSVARAIQYSVRVVGAEHVALGSDFDGGTTMPFDVTGIPLITDALRKGGLSEHEIRLIMGENVVRVLSQTLPE